MPHSLSVLALLVRDYDEAIAFFSEALRCTLLEDTTLGDGKRWYTTISVFGFGDPST